MKKLIVGLLAAFMMTTGLVAFTAPTASAGPGDCPYSGCLNTNTVGVGVGVTQYKKNGKKKKKGTGVITARVDGVGTNVTPVGKVDLTVKKRGSTRVKYTDSGNVNQRGKISFEVPKLKRKATWIFLVDFNDNQVNGWNDSRDKGVFNFN